MMSVEELVAVVSKTVALKRIGRERWAGLCPFHSEATPSFHVWYSDQTRKPRYYCHGCGAKGDAADWMRLFHGKRERYEVDPELVQKHKREKRRECLVQEFFNAHPDAVPEWKWMLETEGSQIATGE